ncbi:hypothetical protein PJ747_004587 [Escherichia coli]|nr:hypothetical protein [Escherichia coli]
MKNLHSHNSLEITKHRTYSPKDLILVDGHRREIVLTKNKNRTENFVPHYPKYLRELVKTNEDYLRLIEEQYPGGNVLALRFDLYRNICIADTGEYIPEETVWDLVPEFFRRLEELAKRPPVSRKQRNHYREFPVFGSFAYGYVKEEKTLHGWNQKHCHCFLLLPAGILQEVSLGVLCCHLQKLWEESVPENEGYVRINFSGQQLVKGKGNSRYLRHYKHDSGDCWHIFPASAYRENNAEFEAWLSRLTYFAKTYQKSFVGKKLFTKVVESPHKFVGKIAIRPCLPTVDFADELDDFYHIYLPEDEAENEQPF